MRLTIEVEDQKADFVLELLQTLKEFVRIESEENLSPQEKELLDERIEEFNNNPEQTVSWASVKAEIEAMKKGSHR
ncbi:MAG: addiction module protein [Cytophagales bacterium]|nr:addiction module protein [Cytophagales bacterium]